MYDVDDRDQVRELEQVPPCLGGAPRPFVMSEGLTTVLAYYVQEGLADWDGRTVRVIRPRGEDLPIAIVRFGLCHAHYVGAPNDEAFEGHPLASRGLAPSAAFEIVRSSWIRRLERMNSVHPQHHPDLFRKCRHFVFAFHDETFECVCERFEVSLTRGSIASVVPSMTALFRWDEE